ncbi:MAG: HAD family hydrolase [Pseudomonadota bacterium]
MELVVFDLDGTLLDGKSSISQYTEETLALLRRRGIAYTVATGRTLHASRAVLEGHAFELPQAFKNGVVIWHPEDDRFSHVNTLTSAEVAQVMSACYQNEVTPFVFTVEGENDHAVYHAPIRNKAEQFVINVYTGPRGLKAMPIDALSSDARISNISAIGAGEAINAITGSVRNAPHLVAYSGIAVEDDNLCWLDIHHSDASKGAAVDTLKSMLGIDRVVCFGDSDNDLSMFASADESYAPANAKTHVKDQADEIIGHHDEDGIARFLRKRFSLDG